MTATFDWFLDLTADDRVLALLELRRHPRSRWIPPAQLLAESERALQMGYRAASQLAQSIALSQSPEGDFVAFSGTVSAADRKSLAHEGYSPECQGARNRLDIRLRVQECDSTHAGFTRHAEYDRRRRAITLYQPSVRRLAESVKQTLGPILTEAQIRNALIAHELFHALESGPFRERCANSELTSHGREVAAHTYAKHAAGFPFLPSALDWLHLAATREIAPESLRSVLEECRGILDTLDQPVSSR